MTENKRFQIIHLGNPYDFVVKDHATNKTYGTLQGDDKSLTELLDGLAEENKQSKMMIATLRNIVLEHEDLEKENKELKQLIKKVMDERVVDYPLLCKIKEMVKE